MSLTGELDSKELIGTLNPSYQLDGAINNTGSLSGGMSYGTIPVVEKDYESLINKPKINNVEIIGNKTPNEYGILDSNDTITIQMINDIWNAIFN